MGKTCGAPAAVLGANGGRVVAGGTVAGPVENGVGEAGFIGRAAAPNGNLGCDDDGIGAIGGGAYGGPIGVYGTRRCASAGEANSKSATASDGSVRERGTLHSWQQATRRGVHGRARRPDRCCRESGGRMRSEVEEALYSEEWPSGRRQRF